MSNKQILDTLNKASKVLNRYDAKLKELDKDVIIFSSVVFTNDKDFYYIFNIYKDNKLIKKVRANNSKEYDKVFTDLTNKYEVNILYNYADLNTKQVNYLLDIQAPKVSKDELDSIAFNNMFDIFK